jgi:4-amino-4-deoxy-L-arabinose transferase-like glycosyltransferase
MTNDIFNGDSALYASIAKNMAESGDWLILNSVMQENWIDKPHLAFWIWAVFIKVFGNTNFGFKLPSLLVL